MGGYFLEDFYGRIFFGGFFWKEFKKKSYVIYEWTPKALMASSMESSSSMESARKTMLSTLPRLVSCASNLWSALDKAKDNKVELITFFSRFLNLRIFHEIFFVLFFILQLSKILSIRLREKKIIDHLNSLYICPQEIIIISFLIVSMTEKS